MDALTIREILDQIPRGQVRIPAFQRGFVWEPERVAYLMDSIYKRYPFGSLLFWRTRQKLRVERSLGPFKLPEPKADYPIDYVLDGQQRITSIFGAFQNDLKMTQPAIWLDIYFDLYADKGPQDTQFCALASDQVDPSRYFPLKALFDTVGYRAATKTLDDKTAERIDKMQEVFKETRIPVQFSDSEDKATVAIIFERVNRQGVELDTLQLLSAWTWSEEFDLQEQFADLADQLAPFGFREIGEDTNLLLRCCSAVFSGDASPEALINMNGATVRAEFDRITNGGKYAVDYLRTHFKVEKLANLPFSTMLVPLSVFFSVSRNMEVSYTAAQSKQIDRWFWRSAFSRRYSSGVIRSLNTDIADMIKLKAGLPSALGDFSVSISSEYFMENIFSMGSVNTKTFILMLAQENPLSFISGAPIDLAKTLKDSNRTEFHHLMPRDFLKKTRQTPPDDSVLANFCFMSRSDNRKLGGDAPSVYRARMAKNHMEILKRALCPSELFDDKYANFLNQRAGELVDKALDLCQLD
jgi:hypothetical protein